MNNVAQSLVLQVATKIVSCDKNCLEVHMDFYERSTFRTVTEVVIVYARFLYFNDKLNLIVVVVISSLQYFIRAGEKVSHKRVFYYQKTWVNEFLLEQSTPLRERVKYTQHVEQNCVLNCY